MTAFRGQFYTVDVDQPTGRLRPVRDQRLINEVAGQAVRMPDFYGAQTNGMLTYTNDSSRANKVKVTPLRLAVSRAWDAAKTGRRTALTRMGAEDAFTVAPAGSTYLDLIGRLSEVALMPRPPMLFDEAFPDHIPFTPGQELVTADLIQFSGRPKFGWKGSLDDIPTFYQSVVTTQLGTMWGILDIPMDIQAEMRSRLSAAALSPTSLVANGLTEMERALDYVGWNGDASAGVYGLLNHPYLPRYQDINIDITTSTQSAVYASFIAAATYAQKNSRGAGKINQALCSYKIRVALESQMFTVGGTAVSQTLWEAIEKAYARFGIKMIALSNEVVWPLDDVGGTGVHGILFSCSDPDRRPGRLWGMELTAYPDQSNPLISHTYGIAVVGDVHLRRADSILLALYTQS